MSNLIDGLLQCLFDIVIRAPSASRDGHLPTVFGEKRELCPPPLRAVFASPFADRTSGLVVREISNGGPIGQLSLRVCVREAVTVSSMRSTNHTAVQADSTGQRDNRRSQSSHT